ncbi:peptidoglycan DD-metalloendopeptidase family protein [Ramlibacter sp. HM2]|uniref:Peptidoglycan DD-metalloendopeptidase family protein n=1 Tax=Ramlibacter pallidus TaxID=2780087 RepID=A0ABR9S7S1_9BURK|nr:peptidoglycan DD-metalloendopeptidase family protein [Ramlibacter pallidus]MBE7369109.1 peptidoglycan DD-metalloendopeptidase family protein [Ramlibacter pallidus]
MVSRARAGSGLLLVLALAMLAGCAAPRRTPAPVEDRGPRVAAPAATAVVEPARVLPGAENAGKPGYYTVKPGDTVLRIALESGQNWKDIVRWNALENPNVIEVGQVLRVVPPAPAVAVAEPPRPAASAPIAAMPSGPASGPVAAASAPSPAAAPSPPAPAADEGIAWAWPTGGGANVLAGFDEQKNKGIDIGGRAGDPVLAAADGRVVYAGAGLRGYGNLIILKHNNTYLTAYAHNQTLLVKEDQSVRKGQKIAEMGSTDTDRVKLHFEIRRQGKPVDPTRYLPPR